MTGGTLAVGTLTSNGAFDVQAGTISADLAGSGALTKTGTGTVTLSGANTYTGDVRHGRHADGGRSERVKRGERDEHRDGGTLDLGGFAQTINAVALSGGTLQNGTLSGAVTSTGGTVNRLGGLASLTLASGTAIAAGTNSLTGATALNGGTLDVTGTVTASNITVGAGGTLSGTGTLGDPTIAAGGTLAPDGPRGPVPFGAIDTEGGACEDFRPARD